ncbi:MAG: T9SS type A sorting domain-containing protein [Ignavibacteriaceae bacterium]|nr:T9SS type A sorting domain-containing protein [Ignavibacteriaceae bacterium]
MKLIKLYLIFSFALLTITNIFGQAAVDIQIMVHDNAGLSYPLWFGLDLAATDSIDPALGESDLPPPPPANVFDARWWIPPFNGSLSSWRDYRSPFNFPFTGNKMHVIKFQTTDFPITISWSLPYIISPSSYLRDPFGGAFINVSFSGTDSVVINWSFIPWVEVSIDYWSTVPVELASFTASVLQNENAVQLNWKTATEINNSGFTIERNSIANPKSEFRNSNWTAIGFVPGFGTTIEPKSYSFIDENVTTGTYKYRLKQIDFDGSFTYSNEIEVQVDFSPKELVLYQNYPNPFNPSTTIKYSLPVESFVRINIYNALGEIIEELVSKSQSYGNYEVTWNAQNYSSGIYYYSFEVNSSDGSQSHREMKKIVFLK